MANEVVKITDQNGVDHPIKDLAAFPRSEQAVLGAKNFVSAKPESATSDTITFTSNSDGTITANTSAPTTQRAYVRAWRGTLKKGRYIFNGCPSGGNNTTGYYMRFQTPSQQFDDVGNGVEVVIDDNNVAQTWSVYIVFEVAGLTADNLVFKPQIRLASDTDDTYAPYAMTNRELTEEVTDQIFEPQHNPNYDSSLSFRIGDNDSHVIVHKIGKIVVINIHDLVASEAVTLTAWVPLLINLPARAKQIGTGIDYFPGILYKNRNEVITVQIDARQIDGVSYGTTLHPTSNVSLNANDKLFGTIVYVCQ